MQISFLNAKVSVDGLHNERYMLNNTLRVYNMCNMPRHYGGSGEEVPLEYKHHPMVDALNSKWLDSGE